MISSSGRHLLELINDILDLSKIEAGHLRVERVTCSPQAIVAQAASELRVRAVEKGLALECEWPDGIPAQILSDPLRLRQLLVNLVGNAIKFTGIGEGADRHAVRHGTTDVRGWPSMWSIPVLESRDDKFESIFDAFVQADNSVTRKFGGTGLGLAISRRIALALGGSLTVESQVGQGSVFTAKIDPGSLEGVEISSAGRHECIRPQRFAPRGGAAPSQNPGRRRRPHQPRASETRFAKARRHRHHGGKRTGRRGAGPGPTVRSDPHGHADAGDGRLRGHGAVALPGAKNAHRGPHGTCHVGRRAEVPRGRLRLAT